MQILQRLRWLQPISFNNHIRYYAKKPKPTMASNKRMVQQEFLHYVNPNARINIKSDIFVKVEPVDVHVYTSGDVFIAQLLGFPTPNCHAKLDVNTSDDDKTINVEVTKVADQANRCRCCLKVPVRAEVHIDGQSTALVESIQGDELRISAVDGITTKNVRATNISLFSENGNIVCEGTLLGEHTEIETHNGNIALDKLQGNSLKCTTKAGSIKTDSCYVEESKFETTTGKMDLRNVHKTCEVHVHEAGDLKMTGVHGNLTVNTKGGSMSLQLSELNGMSQIVADNLDFDAVINISETIEASINIEVKASQVHLNNNLEHVAHGLNNDKSLLKLGNKNDHHLLIKSTGMNGVRLGKQSWMDAMCETINSNDKS